MTSFFSVSVLVSNCAGLGLEAKIDNETGLGLGLGKILGLSLDLGLAGVSLDYSPGAYKTST